MTHGPAAGTRQMLALAASAFVVLAAEPLYLLVDTAVVGHLGTRALAGLGVAAALMAVLTIVGTFVEYGTTARAARWFGAGRRDAAVGEGVQASWLAGGIGLVVIVVGEALAGPLTTLLAGGGGPTQQAAESWFRIAVLGMPGVLLVLAGNGWMRGVQRTREPVRIVLAANGCSAVACPLLVYPAGLGLEGSAIANVAAQAVGALLFLRALGRSAPGGLRPDRVVMRAQVVLGRDLILRAAAFQVAFLSAAGVAARMGSAQVAAHQIGLQLWEFTALLLDSFAIAAQSLVGAALDGVLIGAGDVAFLRTITIVAAVGVFAPLNIAALYWHWGIGGVWAGLSAFIVVRFVGMTLRARGRRWVVVGVTG